MRNLVLGNLGQRISWLLVTTLVLPLLILAAPRQARAQTTRVPSVAALDFGVLPNVAATQIEGRNATDAVALEMTNTGRYEITPRTVLNQELQKQNLTTPLDVIGIQRLGRALGVDYVLTGDIVNVVSEGSRLRVRLAVGLIDVVSGQFVNGAIKEGVSSAPPAGLTPDRQAQLAQAISNAAFLDVQTMNDYTLPEATVLNTSGDSDVVLNRGSRDGIAPGLEMIVVRGREQVGKIKVKSVGATTAIASVQESNKGIRPEDHTRAIFKLPIYTISRTGSIDKNTNPGVVRDYTPRKKSEKSTLSVVLGVAAAVLLAGFLFSNKSSNSGAGVVGVVARAYADGSVIASLDPSAARVELRWEPARDIPVNNIIEYHIWRDDDIIGITTRNDTRFVDTPSRTGQLTYSVVDYGQGSFNPFTTTTGGTTTGGTTTGGTTTGGTTTGGTTTGGAGLGNGLLGASNVNVLPLAVGVTHRYRVSVLYRSNQAPDLSQTGGTTTGGNNIGGNTLGGTNTGGTNIGGTNTGGTNTGGTNTGGTILYRESALEATSGSVTPLARPAVTGPVSDQNLQRVIVTFRTTQGANQYVVEFSSTPDFKKKIQKGPFFANYTIGADTRTEAYDLSTDFASLKAGERVFFRVGARNSLDTPGPMSRDTPNGDDYIYSQSQPQTSFAKLGVPPATP